MDHGSFIIGNNADAADTYRTILLYATLIPIEAINLSEHVVSAKYDSSQDLLEEFVTGHQWLSITQEELWDLFQEVDKLYNDVELPNLTQGDIEDVFGDGSFLVEMCQFATLDGVVDEDVLEVVLRDINKYLDKHHRPAVWVEELRQILQGLAVLRVKHGLPRQ